MSSVESVSLAPAIESDRTGIRDTEQLFGRKLGAVARALWPVKTAAHLAASIGCSQRAAEFYLSGSREWSGAAVAALVAEITRRN